MARSKPAWLKDDASLDHDKLNPLELVEEMDRNSRRGRWGKWQDVQVFGQYGRTETLAINAGHGWLNLQANGECKSISEWESLDWFRRLQHPHDWLREEKHGPGFDLWLKMLAGRLVQFHNMRVTKLRRRDEARKAKAAKK